MSPLNFLLWLLLIWSLGWLALPVSRRIWGRAPGALPDGGLAAGRALILWGWTLLAFWLGNARLSTQVGGLAIYPIAAVLVYYAWRDREGLREFVRERRRALIVSDAVFLVVFVAFFALRGFWPDINNGEKPMDMILISALHNASFLPPPNPYAAGTRLTSYYYLGHYQTAVIGNAVGAIPRWSYNLMCATLPALCYSVIAALAAALTNRLRNGLIAAALLLTAGTLEPLRQWFMPPPGAEPKRWPLDYFATSRVIPNTINEYPWFTFTYADLHAHYFAMPLVLLIVSLGWALYWKREAIAKERLPQILVGVCALALGALLVTNTWDFPVYALFVGLCLVGSEALRTEPLPDASASLRGGTSVAAFSVRASPPQTTDEDVDVDENPPARRMTTDAAPDNEEEKIKPKPRARRTPARGRVGAAANGAMDDPASSRPPASSIRRRARKVDVGVEEGDGEDEVVPPPAARPRRTRAAKGVASSPAPRPIGNTTAVGARPLRPAIKKRPPGPPLHTNPFVRAGLIAAAMAAAAGVCALPFLMDLHSDAQGPELLEQPGSPTGAWLLLWAPIVGAWLFALITEARQRLALGSPEARLIKRFVIVPVAAWLLAKIMTGNDHFVLIFLLTLTIWTAREAFYVKGQDPVYTWLCRTALCGLLALVWSETTWAGFLGPPYHRQDTVFKFGLQAWYLIGLAAVGAAFRDTTTATPEEPDSPDVMAWKYWPRPAQAAFMLMVAVCLVATLSTTMARARDFKTFEGWDAWYYLAPPERRAAAWLYRQARDGATLIEAEEKQGGDYSEYTRYAHATGLSGVIGPQAHTFQWGVGWDDVMARKEDVRAFYATTDSARAEEILRKYNVSYVVCGEMERREYGAEAVARTEERLRVVFQEGEGDERTTVCAAR